MFDIQHDLMENYSAEVKSLSNEGNFKTPSPLSSNSNDGSCESLLSEINEVYRRIEFNNETKCRDREYKFFGKLQKIKEVESSSEHDFENSKTCLKKLSDNSRSPSSKTPVLHSQSITNEVFFDLQREKNSAEDDREVIRNKKSPVKEVGIIGDSDNSKVRDPRARRRAMMHAPLGSSLKQSSRETSSEDESLRNKNTESHLNPKIPLKPIYSRELEDSRDEFNFHEVNYQKTYEKPRKLPVILEPINASLKRRRAEVQSSSSMSYSSSPESSQTMKKFSTIIPQLNLKNCQSPDLSSLSTNREKDPAQRDLDIDVLVEALSHISPKPVTKNSCKKGGYRAKSLPVSARRFQDIEHEKDQQSRTFRIERDDEGAGINETKAWELKPTNAETDLIKGRSDTSVHDLKSFTNASTQVNMRSSLSSLNPSELQQKSLDRFPFTISESSTKNQNPPTQIFCRSTLCRNHAFHDRINPKISITEVIYENNLCRCTSSSENTSTYSSSTDKSTPKSSETKYSLLKPIRHFDHEDKWAERVSPRSLNARNSHDRYSVFFVKGSQVEKVPSETHESNLPSAHKETCSHSEKVNLLEPPKVPTKDSEDSDFDPNAVECFCLQFCNLFRKKQKVVERK